MNEKCRERNVYATNQENLPVSCQETALLNYLGITRVPVREIQKCATKNTYYVVLGVKLLTRAFTNPLTH